MPNVSLEHSINDGDSSVSSVILYEELGIPIMHTSSVKKAMEAMNENLRRSTHTRNPMERLRYDSYMVHHYTYMTNVV